MIIIMSRAYPLIERVLDKLSQSGFTSHVIHSDNKIIITAAGAVRDELVDALMRMQGVEKVIAIDTPFKLVSKAFKAQTQVNVGKAVFGKGAFSVIAGPCAVENYESLLEIAGSVKQAGATLLRGGAFKPRTSPYSFQGLEIEGLKMLKDVSKSTGLGIVTEVVDPRTVDTVAQYADMLQIGARNMHNYTLLKEVAQVNKPILLKRGMAATIEEWLMAAEYIMLGGNEQIVLCERGIRTFEKYTRNTLDLNAVALVKELSHLPVIVDPSHGTGDWKLVSPLAKASAALGADGLMIEVHSCPEEAKSDGNQSLTPGNFAELMDKLTMILECTGKKIMRF